MAVHGVVSLDTRGAGVTTGQNARGSRRATATDYSVSWQNTPAMRPARCTCCSPSFLSQPHARPSLSVCLAASEEIPTSTLFHVGRVGLPVVTCIKGSTRAQACCQRHQHYSPSVCGLPLTFCFAGGCSFLASILMMKPELPPPTLLGLVFQRWMCPTWLAAPLGRHVPVHCCFPGHAAHRAAHFHFRPTLADLALASDSGPTALLLPSAANHPSGLQRPRPNTLVYGALSNNIQ
jgi:hypothetical protein